MAGSQLKTLVEWLATWFGLGRMPFSPGTFGTFGAIPLVLGLVLLGPLPYMIGTIVFIIAAVFIAHLYEVWHHEHDPQSIVIDEVAGFLVSMTWVPLTWQYLLAAFLLFRFLDILKPGPIGYLDRHVEGGLGTVIDDVAAGLVVNVLLQLWLGRF
jgi:phosphatidylglycerophosphatase A